MPIETTCSKCGVPIELPDCPNQEQWYNRLAFSLYSQFANNTKRLCSDCEPRKKLRK